MPPSCHVDVAAQLELHRFAVGHASGQHLGKTPEVAADIKHMVTYLRYIQIPCVYVCIYIYIHDCIYSCKYIDTYVYRVNS